MYDIKKLGTKGIPSFTVTCFILFFLNSSMSSSVIPVFPVLNGFLLNVNSSMTQSPSTSFSVGIFFIRDVFSIAFRNGFEYIASAKNKIVNMNSVVIILSVMKNSDIIITIINISNIFFSVFGSLFCFLYSFMNFLWLFIARPISHVRPYIAPIMNDDIINT